MSASTPTEPTDYDLKIDEQVEKFVETKQKLTYFLVSASVAVIAFMVDFVSKNQTQAHFLAWLVMLSSVAGLFTAGLSLLNLHFELRSYNLHLGYRYEKKTWVSLTPDQQAKWTRINHRAALFLKSAFALLFVEIAFAVIFFAAFFL